MNQHQIDPETVMDLNIENAQIALDAFFDCTSRQENLGDTAIALRTMRLYDKLVKALRAKLTYLEAKHGTTGN